MQVLSPHPAALSTITGSKQAILAPMKAMQAVQIAASIHRLGTYVVWCGVL